MVVSGRPVPASDQFACGSVLWEALVGRKLFEGATDYETYCRLRDCMIQPLRPLRPDVPAPFAQIINRATTSFAWINARWPDGDYTDTLALGKFERTLSHTSPTTGRVSPFRTSSSNPSTSIFANAGSPWASISASRVGGTPGATADGRGNAPATIRSNRSVSPSPVNGSRPVIIAYSTHPSEYRSARASTDFASACCFRPNSL